MLCLFSHLLVLPLIFKGRPNLLALLAGKTRVSISTVHAVTTLEAHLMFLAG